MTGGLEPCGMRRETMSRSGVSPVVRTRTPHLLALLHDHAPHWAQGPMAPTESALPFWRDGASTGAAAEIRLSATHFDRCLDGKPVPPVGRSARCGKQLRGRVPQGESVDASWMGVDRRARKDGRGGANAQVAVDSDREGAAEPKRFPARQHVGDAPETVMRVIHAMMDDPYRFARSPLLRQKQRHCMAGQSRRTVGTAVKVP